jgi:hypothetical protein
MENHMQSTQKVTEQDDLSALFQEDGDALIADKLFDMIDAGTPSNWLWREANSNKHLFQIAQEFSGKNFIDFYHAGLSMFIRRNATNGHYLGSFLRLWERHSAYLLKHLDTRWLVAACDTYADHGTAEEKGVAFSAVLLANTIKLYETENKLDKASHKHISTPDTQPLFDGVQSFRTSRGDMVSNIVRRSLKSFPKDNVPSLILTELLRRFHLYDTVFRRMDKVQTRPNLRSRINKNYKVAVFNDTHATRHFGCECVMSQIEHLFSNAKLDIIHSHPLRSDWRTSKQALSAIKDADIIVVNGEGTIHHDGRRAAVLSQLGPHCSALKKPIYLINATILENGSEIVENLRHFTHIWVRETDSAAFLRRHGIAHSVLPDLTFTAPFKRRKAPILTQKLFVDSVDNPALEKLASFAESYNAPLWTMKHGKLGNGIAHIPQTQPDGKLLLPAKKMQVLRNPNDFGNLLRSAEHLITGRFHSVTFAIKMGVPFHAFPSNTRKIEATIADISLSPDRILDFNQECPDLLPFSDFENAAITAYIQNANSKTQEMLRVITAG